MQLPRSVAAPRTSEASSVNDCLQYVCFSVGHGRATFAVEFVAVGRRRPMKRQQPSKLGKRKLFPAQRSRKVARNRTLAAYI